MEAGDTVFDSTVGIASLALKAAVGRWGYSGKNDLPMLGDFEAQRHWMEVAIGLPIGDWYRNTTDNDLQYWGLDYPPLTAYVSWACGTLAHHFYPKLVILHDSRAHEEAAGKFFMRFTVLLADILILTPAISYSLRHLTVHQLRQFKAKNNVGKHRTANQRNISFTLLLLLCLSGPTSVLIDHGHFQYNGVCIGLSLFGAMAISNNMDVIGSVLFCLSLNFKQMSLYYAPVFFFVLLRKCADKSNWYHRALHLLKIGITVILSFVALWWPFCLYAAKTETCISSLVLVLSRQFPFARGIFEDKVANLWYATSVVIDFRKYLTTPQLAQMSLCLTLLLISPIAVDLLRRKLSPTRLILALVNCSMAFFLASFQVHEKSLLLPLIPSLLLLNQQPLAVFWFQILGAFTMFPMLVRDGLRTPYFAVCALFLSILVLYLEMRKTELEPGGVEENEKSGLGGRAWARLGLKALVGVSFAGMFLLHCLEAFMPPPGRYPDLYPALFSLFGAANLLVIYFLGTCWQLAEE